MAENKINVGGRLHSIATGNVLGGANEIFDDDKNKKQSDINTETYSLVNNVNERLNGLSPEQQSALNVATKATNNEVKLGYYVCGTEGDVAAKVISDATGYVLSKGGSMKVKMTNANTAVKATLNINSTGAKPLYYAGERATSNNSWEAGETVEVYYDGTSYYANSVAGGSSDGVFDISAKTGNTYETLSAALTAANSILSAGKKKGGISIKFIQTITPAKYTVVKTEGVTEQQTGTEIQSDPGIISGTYTAGELSVFSTLPATLNSSLTYYLAVTETVDEQEVTTYTSWVITYVQSSDNKYVQYRYVGTSTAIANFSNVANWELDVTSRDLFGLLSEIKGFQIYSYSLQASNKFGTSSSYKHAAIPVNEGEVYYLIGNTDTVKAAYATSNSYSYGGDIPLVSGTGVVSMSAIKQYYKFVIPEGCNFLLFNASDNYGTRCFKYYDSLKDSVYEFVDDEPTDGSDHLVKSGGVFNNLKNMKLVGKGDTLVESPHLTNFKSGNVYRVYIKNPNISLDGVTTSDKKIRFSISAHLLNGNDVDIMKIYTNTYESPLSDFYTFTAPDNFEYVTISMRAANSAEQTFFIEDVSYATVNQNDILHLKENTSTSVVNYSIGNCSILIDGKFGNGVSTGIKHGIIKVQEGEDYLVYGRDVYTRYAFATSDEYVPSGDIPLVNGTTVMNVPDNTVKSVVIPDGCEYLLINITIASPFNVKKVLGKIDDIQKETDDIQKETDDIQKEIDDIQKEIDDIQKEIDEVAVYYMPDILIGNKELYISDQLSSEFTLDTFNKVYNEYDALCTLYPNLIRRKEDIGVDSDGNTIRHYILMNYLPIVGLSSMYTYETVPKENTWDTYFSYKRFLITSGVHGDEKSAVVGLLYFLQDLLASNDDWAVYIKSNVCLDIIPIIDPWGYDNNSRKNKLNIDLNRDYFNLTSVEAIAMTNYIQSIKDDIHAVIDNHSTSGKLCYLASKTDSERFGVLMKAINQISSSCVTSWDALATQIGLSNIYRNYAYGCISTNNGTLPDYIIKKNITPLACTVETIKRTSFMNPVAKFTKDIIGNLIQMLITVN